MRNNQNKFNGLRFAKKKFEKHYYNNCYTFAINQNVNPYTNEPFDDYDDCQPGWLGGEDKGRDYYESYEEFPKWIAKDLDDIGLNITPSTIDEYVEDKNAWKIAFCWCDGECGSPDYHFYRQNKNGTWSHKQGVSFVRKVDDDGETIYNPQECNRGRYNMFGGFFIIKPKVIN